MTVADSKGNVGTVVHVEHIFDHRQLQCTALGVITVAQQKLGGRFAQIRSCVAGSFVHMHFGKEAVLGCDLVLVTHAGGKSEPVVFDLGQHLVIMAVGNAKQSVNTVLSGPVAVIKLQGLFEVAGFERPATDIVEIQ